MIVARAPDQLERAVMVKIRNFVLKQLNPFAVHWVAVIGLFFLPALENWALVAEPAVRTGIALTVLDAN